MTVPSDDEHPPDRSVWQAIPTQRRLLWAVAAVALAVMGIAAWQLRTTDGAPTAAEAIDSSVPNGAGEEAPGFEVTLRGGGDFSLDQHFAVDGRPVLLNLWASWCIPCRNEMPLLDDVAPLYPSVLFFGVAVNDTRSSAEDFADEVGVAYQIGFDELGMLTDNYPAPAMPVTYIIDADRTIRSRFFGELTAGRIDDLLRDVS